MTKDEALKMALSTLNEVRSETFRLLRNGQKLYAENKVWDTVFAIKKVLAQSEQEPVAWDNCRSEKQCQSWCGNSACGSHWSDTTPPQRKPLSDEEILHRVDTHVGGPSPSYPLDNSDWLNFARAIEAAHGIKGDA